MWTQENRRRYDRSKLRYPSDLTDEEWSHVAPLIPPAKRGGSKRTVNVREVVNGLMYILSSGCQWRAIPKDLPPRSTLHDYFELWEWDGTLEDPVCRRRTPGWPATEGARSQCSRAVIVVVSMLPAISHLWKPADQLYSLSRPPG